MTLTEKGKKKNPPKKYQDSTKKAPKDPEPYG